MSKISIAGLNIDALTKPQLLEVLEQRLDRGQATFLTTPYSEFLYAALQDPETRGMLNRADLAVADGMGIVWAAKYLSIPLKAKSYYGKIFEALWQMKYTLWAAVFRPSYIRSIVPEKITGADLFFDLAALAARRGQSVYLLGGFGDTAERVAKVLQAQYTGINIVGTSASNPDDLSTIADIKQNQPDFLFVAYGPIRQEQWIVGHWSELGVKLAVGLGGTFDYIAGKRASPAGFIRSSGFEWLFRLFTQPRRFKRIIRATFGLAGLLWHYKVFIDLPLRSNVAVVILNQNNEVLVCQRNPEDFYVDIIKNSENLKSQNYWQLPQGGIDANENVVAAAQREAREETGIKSLELLKVSSQVHTYIWNSALRGFWKNRHHRNKGQTQQIAYFKFFGPSEEVKVDKHEFINYKWVPVKDLHHIIHPERAGLTTIVQQDLKDLA